MLPTSITVNALKTFQIKVRLSPISALRRNRSELQRKINLLFQPFTPVTSAVM